MNHNKLITQRLNETAELLSSFSPELIAEISAAAQTIISALKAGNKVLLAGNGGSAADAQHIAGELVGKFYKDRDPLPAIALHTNSSIITALANDYGYETVFERQVKCWGKKGDVLIGLSTSGKSPNILRAFDVAKKQGLKIIAFTGAKGLPSGYKPDHLINISATDTPRIQEAHITIAHIICEIVESQIFGR
ncbi:MAG: D-sedoheptulose 7-phosphate isomerase [Pseudomonadota bacterium]